MTYKSASKNNICLPSLHALHLMREGRIPYLSSNLVSCMASRKLIILFIIIEIVIVVLGFLTEGYSLAALQTITRFSGSLSLFLFSAIFLLNNKPYTITAWLSDRFYLLFAIVHGIHLAELLTFIYLADIELVPYRLAGGFMAYLFVFAMPFLQSFKMRGQISKRTYLILETIFIYYVWLVFFL